LKSFNLFNLFKEKTLPGMLKAASHRLHGLVREPQLECRRAMVHRLAQMLSWPWYSQNTPIAFSRIARIYGRAIAGPAVRTATIIFPKRSR
jgi:hypothetical protein